MIVLAGLVLSAAIGVGGLLLGLANRRLEKKKAEGSKATAAAQTSALQESAAASKASAASMDTHLAAIADAANKVLSDQSETLKQLEARLKAVEDRLPAMAKPDPRVQALEAAVSKMGELAKNARTGLIPFSDGPSALRKAEDDRAAADRAVALKQQELDLQRRRLEMDEQRAQSEANWRVWNELVKPAIFPEKKKRKPRS